MIEVLSNERTCSFEVGLKTGEKVDKSRHLDILSLIKLMQRHEDRLLLVLLSVFEHVVELLVNIDSKLVGVSLLKGVTVLLYDSVGFC